MPTSSQLDRTRFFGRESLVHELTTLAGAGVRAGLVGPSGCGKSRLAREVAMREPAARYVDAAGFDPSLLTGAKLVLVEGDPASIEANVGPDVSVVRCDAAYGDRAIEVGPLETDTGLAMLIDRVRVRDGDFAAEPNNRADLESLVEMSGGWPIVIEQIARRLTLFTPAELVEQARSGALPLQAESADSAWAREFERLAGTERAIASAALALPAGFELSAITEIVRAPSDDVLDAIATLADALILRRIDPRGAPRSRFVMDQSARASALSREAWKVRGQEMVVAYWLGQAQRLWQLSVERGNDELVAFFQNEEPNVRHAFETVRHHDTDTALWIGAALFYTCRSRWSAESREEWANTLHQAVASGNDTTAREAAYFVLARVLRSSRRFLDAVELLEPHVTSEITPTQLCVQMELARSLNLADRFDAAQELFVQVRDEAPRAWRAVRADALLGVALRANAQLDFALAREQLTRALGLARDIDARITRERARQAQISATIAQGDFEAAYAHATAILDELGESADFRRVAGAHLQLADISLELGDRDQIVFHIEQAEARLEGREYARIAGYCSYVRANLALLNGEPRAALGLLADAAEGFAEEPAGVLVEIASEIARTMANPTAATDEHHDDVARRSWEYWSAVGAFCDLMFVACRRYAGNERPGDHVWLAEFIEDCEARGTHGRLAAARFLAGEDVEPRGFDGALIARMFPREVQSRLRLGPGARWFQVGTAERVDISGRKALPELLEAVARAGGESLDPYELAEAGWPDEELHPETAKNRVYVAIHALRKMGLAEMLRTEGGGYALEHGVVIETVD